MGQAKLLRINIVDSDIEHQLLVVVQMMMMMSTCLVNLQ